MVIWNSQQYFMTLIDMATYISSVKSHSHWILRLKLITNLRKESKASDLTVELNIMADLTV